MGKRHTFVTESHLGGDEKETVTVLDEADVWNAINQAINQRLGVWDQRRLEAENVNKGDLWNAVNRLKKKHADDIGQELQNLRDFALRDVAAQAPLAPTDAERQFERSLNYLRSLPNCQGSSVGEMQEGPWGAYVFKTGTTNVIGMPVWIGGNALTDIHEVHGGICQMWLYEYGGPMGPLGLPVSDEMAFPEIGPKGRVSWFRHGGIAAWPESGNESDWRFRVLTGRQVVNAIVRDAAEKVATAAFRQVLEEDVLPKFATLANECKALRKEVAELKQSKNH